MQQFREKKKTVTTNLKSYPFFLKCSIILEMESTGTEKPNPSAANTFIIFTPTTSPSRLTRGPPEFPYNIKHIKKTGLISKELV